MTKLNHLNYYRLPWNLTDNIISWLEPTAKCNLACFGCYRKNEVDSHKPLEQVKEEIQLFTKMRNTDAMSIAGGDPLLHPEITEIVSYIKQQGLKPIVNTNGIALTKELLMELKRAGVYGFTFHIDSKQNRPGWKDSDELKLNELRYYFAKMLSDAGNISCSFNSTVYRDTMHFIPGMTEWAHKNVNIVNVMVFILYRAVTNDLVDFYLGPRKIDMSGLVYNEEETKDVDLKTEDIYNIFKTMYPDYDGCAYLNGSEKPDSFKWFLTGRLATKDKIYGYLGPKTMEIVQMFNHLLFGKYLSYTSPRISSQGKGLLLLSLFDKKIRKAAIKFLANPLNIFRKLYYQSVMIIQPVDIMDDGRQSMCDGCPDITVWDGKLVWSCRLEEQLNYGVNLRTFPKNAKASGIKEFQEA